MNLEATTELCRALADPTRIRLLRLLTAERLSVAELVEVTRLGQSRVSTHLGKLREAGLVRARKLGRGTCYESTELPAPVAALCEAADDPLLAQDLQRAAEVVQARETERWADSVAGRMGRHYSPGRTWESFARGAVGLVRLGRVLDVASGDGALAELLSPRVEAVTCVDRSQAVTDAGRSRLAHLGNVRFVRADMHALPLADASHDAGLLMSALCHAGDPSRVLREVARVLRPGAPLVVVSLAAHDHRDAVARYDHLQLGFEPAALRGMLVDAGFDVRACAPTQRERRAPHFEVITAHATRSPSS